MLIMRRVAIDGKLAQFNTELEANPKSRPVRQAAGRVGFGRRRAVSTKKGSTMSG